MRKRAFPSRRAVLRVGSRPSVEPDDLPLPHGSGPGAHPQARHGDVKGAVALYADDAIVVWPGAGEEAKGKAAIEKLVTDLCDPKTNPKPVLKSDVGVQLDDSHISIIGKWELTQTDPHGKRTTSQIRTSEIIAKTPAGWRYIVDHASIGVPAPKATKKHAR